MELETLVDDIKCFFSPIKLSGCGKCEVGTQLEFSCRTSRGTTIAHIECESLPFAVVCYERASKQMVHLAFDKTDVNETCYTRCGIHTTRFKLIGQLYHADSYQSPGFHQENTASIIFGIPELQRWLRRAWDWITESTTYMVLIIFAAILAVAMPLCSLCPYLCYFARFRTHLHQE